MCGYIIILSIGLLFIGAVATAQEQSTPVARCFQFTWLGPRYNNRSVNFMNATCDDATRLAQGVPCQQPLVVSYDGTWPDVEYIWTHYPLNASCIPKNDVCAKFTYYYDGQVENSTYMCTRAVDTMGHSIKNGCYEQVNGSFSTKVCFCQSVAGGVPCNDAISSTHMSIISFFIAFLAACFINRNFANMYIYLII